MAPPAHRPASCRTSPAASPCCEYSAACAFRATAMTCREDYGSWILFESIDRYISDSIPLAIAFWFAAPYAGMPDSGSLELILDYEATNHCAILVDGETFPAHRAVLAARSPVFRAELLGSMAEAKMSCITLHDIEPVTFRALLRFVYTDELPADDGGELNTTAMATERKKGGGCLLMGRRAGSGNHQAGKLASVRGEGGGGEADEQDGEPTSGTGRGGRRAGWGGRRAREEREKVGKGAEGDSHRAGRPMSLRGEGGGGEALSPSISLSWWP
ncbi:hypothetical protein OsI_29949 [Oryza sativa Indica Group]|uniref:BTB domain-containing protein n=1 Tax=Oryza sativa subsp. indica TaxID=39946 RepID=A2YX81_ORYSI|nr:hypothetical protein OsI_29949 [Oryza sativa Indica Group]